MALPTNLFAMAQNMANNMTDADKAKLSSLDMEKMVGEVTKKCYGNDVGGRNDGMNIQSILSDPNVLAAAAPIEGITTEPPHPPIEEVGSEDGEEEEDLSFPPRTKDLHFNLNVRLEDLYTGKRKKISVKRKRLKDDKIVSEKKKIAIPIISGMRDQQVIRFHKEADEKIGHEAGDIVITICEQPHNIFERDGNNLYFSKNISLSESYQFDFILQHLDGTTLRVVSQDILHTNDGLRKIPGKGMPIFNRSTQSTEEGQYGDLFIKFNVVYPETLLTIKRADLFD